MKIHFSHISRIGIGATLALMSMIAYFSFLYYVVQAGQTLLLPEVTVSTDAAHQELARVVRETKKDREFVTDHFTTADTFLGVFAMLEQIKKNVGGALTVESVNAESQATKQTAASVRVVLKTSGTWSQVDKTIRALTVMPVVLSVLTVEVSPHPDTEGVFDARAVLRVYIKPQL